MGYDLHITRRTDWSMTGNDVTVPEWLAYVARDPELSLWPENGPYMARWSGKSKHSDAWLDWFKGNVYTKNPDQALIEKMIHIAHELGATVQGDDGETYPTKHAALNPSQSMLGRLKDRLRWR